MSSVLCTAANVSYASRSSLSVVQIPVCSLQSSLMSSHVFSKAMSTPFMAMTAVRFSAMR